MQYKILIIDDDPQIVKSFARSLDIMGYDVLTSDNGEEAIQLYKSESPDIVLVDLRMPDMDGLQVVEAIHDMQPEAYIIIITAHGDKELVIRALRKGVADFVFKPIDQTMLRAMLQRAKNRIQLQRELRSMRVALQDSEEQVAYQAYLLQQVTDAVIATDMDLKIKSWNQGATNMYGWREDEVKGRNLDAMLQTEFLDVSQAEAQQALLQNHTWEGLISQRHKAGALLYVMASVTLLRDEQEQIIGAVTVNRDVTARRQAEEALRHERDLFARITETSPAGIVVTDQQGRIVFANARAETILNLKREASEEQVYHAPVWRITDHNGHPFPSIWHPFQKVMKTAAAVYDVRYAIEDADGKRVLLSVNAAPLLDVDGQASGVVFTLNDITERAREEEQRIAQLENELLALESLSVSAQTSITAQMFGVKSVKQGLPDVFVTLAERYEAVLDMALEQRFHKVEKPISETLRMLAQNLGFLKAGARDVVDIHTTALKHKREENPILKAQAYAEEGRLVALELMGYLVLYYRNYAAVATIRSDDE